MWTAVRKDRIPNLFKIAKIEKNRSQRSIFFMLVLLLLLVCRPC